jgi:hypothetical protein
MPVVGFAAIEIVILLVVSFVPGLAGTILGALAIGDLRREADRLRGRALALFAALAWPLISFNLILVLAVRVVVFLPFVGTISLFPILLLISGFFNWWLTSAAWRRAHGLSGPGHSLPPEQKWRLRRIVWPVTAAVTLPLLILSAAWFTSRTWRPVPISPIDQAAGGETHAPAFAMNQMNAIPVFNLTVTAVELREDAQAGGHWLAIDFADETDCDCELVVRSFSGNPNEQVVTRKSGFLKDDLGRARVKHQRIEWRLPADLDPTSRLALRESVVQDWLHHTITLRPGDEQLVLKVPLTGGGTLTGYLGAKFKDNAPLKN